jgi:hypothetical protein
MIRPPSTVAKRSASSKASVAYTRPSRSTTSGELDPAPQLFARLRGKVLVADLKLPGISMVREHLRQGTERVVEAGAVLALLEESLQAAQDQRRASCRCCLAWMYASVRSRISASIRLCPPSVGRSRSNLRLMSEGRLPDGDLVIYAPFRPLIWRIFYWVIVETSG